MINNASKKTRLNILVEVLIFLSSYYPLFLILFIQDITHTPNYGDLSLSIYFTSFYVSKIGVGMLVLSSVCLLLVAKEIRDRTTYQEGGYQGTIVTAKQVRGDMLNYTIPFLIGLFAFSYDSWQLITSLFVFLTFMFLFLRQENMILLNPMFLLLGIRLYHIEFKELGSYHVKSIDVLCGGEMSASDVPIVVKENAGINFAYPVQKVSRKK